MTAIFVYGYPSIAISSGDGKTGATGGRLEDPLVVSVKDGKNRGIPMAIVTFSSGNLNSNIEGSQFLPVPGTTVHVDDTDNWANAHSDIANINDPVTATSLYPKPADADNNNIPDNDDVVVQTDRSGDAQVYFQLGSAVGRQNVTVNSVGASQREFRTTAVDASRSASLVVVSGNNQRSDAATHDVEDPLVVRTRRVGGYRIANVIVRFTALGGVLEPGPGTVQAVEKDEDGNLTTTEIGPPSGQEIFVMTNAHGEAAVIYNTGQLAGAKTVTARVDDEQKMTQYDFQIRQVEFNIDGGGRISNALTNALTTNAFTMTPSPSVAPSMFHRLPQGPAGEHGNAYGLPHLRPAICHSWRTQ